MDVKKLREKFNYTQAQFAEMCGVTLRTVQNWEKGKKIPTSTEKLLNLINEGKIVTSNLVSESKDSVATDKENDVTPTFDTKRFFSTLEKQLEIMCRQLEEMTELRKQTQKKDEQIETLLGMLKTKLESQS